MLASCGDCVRTWAVQEGALRARVRMDEHVGAVTCVRWNHNAQVLASCGEDGLVALTHVSGTLLSTLRVAESDAEALNCISFSSGSRYLVSGGDGGVALVWDLKKRKPIRRFAGHAGPITCASFSGGDDQLASGGARGGVLLHRVATARAVGRLESAGVAALHYSPLRRDLLAATGDGGFVSVWDVTSEAAVAAFPAQHGDAGTAVAFSPLNSLLLASAGLDGRVAFCDVQAGHMVKELRTPEPVTAVAFHPNGWVLASGATDGAITLHDLRNASEPLNVTPAHEGGEVGCVSFSSSGSSGSSTGASGSSTGASGSSTGVSSPAPARAAPVISPEGSAAAAPLRRRGDIVPSSSPPRSRESPSQEAPAPAPAVAPSPARPPRPAAETPIQDLTVAVRERYGTPATMGLPLPPDSGASSAGRSPPRSPPVAPSPAPSQAAAPAPAPAAAPAGSAGAGAGAGAGEVLQQRLLEAALQDCVADLRADIHRDVQNVHLELLRQFQAQQRDIEGMLDRFSERFAQLMAENEQLRKENEILRNIY